MPLDLGDLNDYVNLGDVDRIVNNSPMFDRLSGRVSRNGPQAISINSGSTTVAPLSIGGMPVMVDPYMPPDTIAIMPNRAPLQGVQYSAYVPLFPDPAPAWQTMPANAKPQAEATRKPVPALEFGQQRKIVLP